MTPEQKQQLEQVREQQAAHSALFDAHDSHKIVQRSEIRTMLNSIDFLLSLVKSQEATPSKSVVRRLAQQGAICRECLYSPTLDLVRLCPRHAAIDDAANSMRSACVEKVKAMGQQWYAEAKNRGAAFSDKGRLAEVIAKELESLSIEKQSRSL